VEARIDNQTGFVANDQALVRPVGMVNIIPLVQELPTMVAHSHNLQSLPPPQYFQSVLSQYAFFPSAPVCLA